MIRYRSFRILAVVVAFLLPLLYIRFYIKITGNFEARWYVIKMLPYFGFLVLLLLLETISYFVQTVLKIDSVRNSQKYFFTEDSKGVRKIQGGQDSDTKKQSDAPK